MAVENSKVVVQGWIAGSAPVHEIRMSIDDIQVGTVSEPDVCRDLLLPDYENANKFAFRLPSVSLPNRVDQDVNFSATAHFVTGEAVCLSRTIHIASSVEKALRVLDRRPDEPVESYLHLALDLFEFGRLADAQRAVECASNKFPDSLILRGMTAGFCNIDSPYLVSLAGTQVSVEGWMVAPRTVAKIEAFLEGSNTAVYTGTIFERRNLPGPILDRYEDKSKIGFQFSNIPLPADINGNCTISCLATFATGETHQFSKSFFVARTIDEAARIIENEAPSAYVTLASELIQSGRDKEGQLILAVAARKFPNDYFIMNTVYGARLAKLDQRDSSSSRDIATVPHSADDDDAPTIIGSFESLGFNCEFGVAQRAFGCEPLGLLRFAGNTLDILLVALDTDFAGLGEPQYTHMYPLPDSNEYHLVDSQFGFSSHTSLKLASTEAEFAKLFHKQCKRLVFLKEKLLFDLKETEKIFLYYDYDRLSDASILQLFKALQRHGPNSLFCVRLKEKERPAGTVDLVEDRLAIGYIETFSRADDVPAFVSPQSWLPICRTARQLLGSKKRSENI